MGRMRLTSELVVPLTDEQKFLAVRAIVRGANRARFSKADARLLCECLGLEAPR